MNRLDEIAARDHSGQRMAIAHGLAQGDDVGNDAELLMSPHMTAQPAEARLHLIGNEEAAGRVDVRERLGHESGGNRGQSLAGEGGAEQQTRKTDTRGGERVDGAFYLIGVGRREFFIAAARALAVGIHDRHGAHVRPPLILGCEQGTHLHYRRRVAVIGPGRRYDAESAAAIARNSQCQLVRLAPGAAEHGHW